MDRARSRLQPPISILVLAVISLATTSSLAGAGGNGTHPSHLHGGGGWKGAHRNGHHDAADPVPIPGGAPLPDGTVLHVFAPGPVEGGLQGLDVEPSTIGNFDGFSALAYPAGTATDAAGKSYDMFNDMRIYRGNYVAADGRVHHGTFGFV